ncbi:leiomodin-2a [Alosa alosa]|uniref:leiomodin-2a n=1 Tax=Alosa alosa TaxID=278164 RepID=UPI002015173A|nr:leiomodin-2a [Alosa alosa]
MEWNAICLLYISFPEKEHHCVVTLLESHSHPQVPLAAEEIGREVALQSLVRTACYFTPAVQLKTEKSPVLTGDRQSTMSSFGYRRELDKYENVDEEELLATLSDEELRELERELADIEPDDAVPTGLRQRDQTAGNPTGSFYSDALLKHWDNDCPRLQEVGGNMEEGQTDKREVDSVTRGDGQSSALKDADRNIQRDSRSEAGKTGRGKREEYQQLHVNNSHPGHGEVTTTLPCRFKGPKNRSIIPNHKLKSAPEQQTRNPVVIDDVLEMVICNKAALKEINLNNAEDIPMETMVRLAEALSLNTHVRVFSLANTHANDHVASSVARMLHKNSTVATVNMDSNLISGSGVLTLMASLRHNSTLKELRLHNQRHMCGGRVEMEMVQLLQENTTLLKLGFHFELPGPRMSATCLLTRNQDRQRQQRLQQRQQQNTHSHRTNGPTGCSHVCDEETDSSSQTSTNSLPALRPLPRSPPPPPESVRSNSLPTRQIAEVLRQQEGSCFATRHTSNQKPERARTEVVNKKRENLLRDMKSALRPSSVRKTKESAGAHLPQQSTHSDLMEAIRSSSARSLRRVTTSLLSCSCRLMDM